MKVLRSIHRMIGQHQSNVNQRQTRRALLQMTDRELEDIGLPRERLYVSLGRRSNRA